MERMEGGERIAKSVYVEVRAGIRSAEEMD